jgi:hypothetical protein
MNYGWFAFNNVEISKSINFDVSSRHIQTKHASQSVRIENSIHCETCKEVFDDVSLKTSHLKAERCDWKDPPTSNDPLDGIDIKASDTLKSKGRRQGRPALEQYHGIWKIIFPGESANFQPGKSTR